MEEQECFWAVQSKVSRQCSTHIFLTRNVGVCNTVIFQNMTMIGETAMKIWRLEVATLLRHGAFFSMGPDHAISSMEY